MSLWIIHTSQQYEDALAQIDTLMDTAKKWTPEGDMLELLVLLVQDYENKQFPIPSPDPVEAIRYRMEQLSMKNKDLWEVIWYPTRASEILNRKRRLTLPMIRKIHKFLQIPLSLLVKEYSLA